MNKTKKKISKFFYKIFTKRWNTIILKNENFDSINELIIFLKNINTKNFNKKFIKSKVLNKAADPFLFEDHIYYEKLNWPFNKGFIERLNIKNKSQKVTYLQNYPHTSFPTIYKNNKKLFLLTESKSWSYPFFYEITNSSNSENKKLKEIIFEIGKYKLIDPFIFKKSKNFYLFGTDYKDRKLKLFFSKNLFGPYKNHKNVIFKNKKESFRSGGKIFCFKNEYYRISQKHELSYGDGLEIYKIISISNLCYREKFISSFSFKSKNGPHTLSINSKYIAVDYFQLSIDPIAKLIKLNQLISNLFKNVLFS